MRVDCRDVFPKYSIEEIEDNLPLKKSASERVQCVEHFLLSISNRSPKMPHRWPSWCAELLAQVLTAWRKTSGPHRALSNVAEISPGMTTGEALFEPA